MTSPFLDRRTFLQSAAATALLGPLVAQAQTNHDPVMIACVGVGGKGWSDMLECSKGNEIVAICDIDEGRLLKASEQFPKAKKFADWRKLLEMPGIDAVTISTPDHMHAPVTLSAIHAGKHVYGQKPLTHSVKESRTLTEAAQEAGVVTQMGIQHHATARLKLAVDALRKGVVGKVHEVHVWTDRPGNFWKQGLTRPEHHDPAPKTVAWDLWLGVAPERPYVASLYHPFHWRGWWDFGTGALGDMGCHLLDPVVHGLELGAPKTVMAEGPEPSPESGPLWCEVQYTFPGTKHTTDEVLVHWYEAGRQPDRELFDAPEDWAGSKNGVLYRGSEGNLFVGFPEMPELFPKAKFADYEWPDMSDHNHYQEWTNAVAGIGKTSCPFEYSGPLTETVLLGNVAYRSQSKINWNSEELVCEGNPGASEFLHREYRKGWSIPNLG
ncbi:Gfo/Idh/MocA family oxidoreductase [Thalassoglobus sp. JC818]|uniref:Gfo/Idh/MocA family protein n=1 Tax=Thalassoglobus sp. JC818 TaxID=3232136 RepID=UPI003459003A